MRDMVSIMNIDVARKLPAFFDTKILGMIPAAAAASIISEEARMMEVADMLSKQLDEYRNIMEDRWSQKLNGNLSNDQDITNMNQSINPENWAICADFIGLSSDEEKEEEEEEVDNKDVLDQSQNEISNHNARNISNHNEELSVTVTESKNQIDNQ